MVEATCSGVLGGTGRREGERCLREVTIMSLADSLPAKTVEALLTARFSQILAIPIE